ncbi:MAG: MOSC domain-containing protein, partial [Flavobacteriales bacterium]
MTLKKMAEGRISSTLLTASDGGLCTSPSDGLIFDLDGLQNDKHYGNTKAAGGRDTQLYKRGIEIKNHRPWSAISQDELENIAKGMGIKQLKGEWIGANFIVEGVSNFSQVPPLSRLVFENGPVLVVYEENAPCKFPQPHIEANAGKTTKTFASAAKGQ